MTLVLGQQFQKMKLLLRSSAILLMQFVFYKIYSKFYTSIKDTCQKATIFNKLRLLFDRYLSADVLLLFALSFCFHYKSNQMPIQSQQFSINEDCWWADTNSFHSFMSLLWYLLQIVQPNVCFCPCQDKKFHLKVFLELILKVFYRLLLNYFQVV